MSVRIGFRIFQFRRYAVFQFLRDEVFEPFGFLMDLIPAVVEKIVKEAFEQPMVPNDLQSSFLTGCAQPRAVMFFIFNKRWLNRSQLLQHSGHRSGPDSQALSQCVTGYFALFRAAELQDGLEVVVDRFSGVRWVSFEHSELTVYPGFAYCYI